MPIRLLLVLILIVPVTLPLYAQSPQPGGTDGEVLLSPETLTPDTPVDLSTVLWRFREGDDPAWANPATNDSAWALIDTDFRPDALYPDLWQGLGWFRLHLRVDSSLHDTILGLYTYHAGASEIYLDGQKIGGFGVIGATAADDQTYTPKGLPLSFYLDGRDAHVLAVRYANRALSARTFEGYGRTKYVPAGFALVVGHNNPMMRSYAFEKGVVYNDAFIMGLLVTILILHLLLYLFDRRDRANLFYALAVVFLCIAHFCGHAAGYRVLVIDGSWNLVWLDQVMTQSFVLFLFLLLATLYTLFTPRLLRWLWIPFLLWVVVAGLWYTSGRLVPYLGFIIPMLVLLFEAVRVSFYAVYQRKEGAWILGAALLFTLVVVLLLLFVFESAAGRSRLMETPSLVGADGILLFLFFVPVPLGMTILLARRFARRSRRLERELERVEELSAKTLAQEREKQALIASQNERLEAEVAERTAELKESLNSLRTTQAQLVQQEKLASLGQLTAGIAHEIKNPLNFINNFSEIVVELSDELQDLLTPYLDASLQGEADDFRIILGDLRQNAGVIAQHGKRADAIVHAMMQHASGSKGQCEATDLNALVSEHIDLAYHGKRAQLPDLTVHIQRDLDPEVGAVKVVPQEIGRVLLNLLGNAFDAVYEHAASVNGQYAPKVIVTTRRNGEAVEIHVADNGPGIPEDFRGKIFEPFFTTKPTGSGTGLGLSLSYDIVTQGHGGTLTVESKDGAGAAFTMTLPAHTTEPDASA